MKSNWTPLTKRTLPGLIQFLAPVEWSCVSFTDKLGGGHTPRLPEGNHRVIVRLRRDGRVDGAILQSAGGLYHPVLDAAAPNIEEAAAAILLRGSRRLFSIMGITRDVYALESALRRSARQEVEYHLMVQDEPPVERPYPRLPQGMAIRKACESDSVPLIGLQEKYEIEEVLLDGSRFNRAASLRRLVETLRTQVVYVAEWNGTPIAKAGTNARGFFYDQIGGVFTDRRLRSKGIGSQLMRRLLSHIADEKKSGTLFVKKHNAPALRMYRGLGFAIQESFRISYFG